MNKQTLTIWGREFELDIVFDCYKGESILPAQTDVLNKFLKNAEIVNQAKSAVESYCIQKDSDLIGTSGIDNIFKYVIPKSIYVQRAKDNRHLIGLMCNYKYDVEHGLVIIFENERFKSIGIQDEIL
jgi:hypothetical protein